jgi:uncharacterized iron-regulated membrane protein
VRSVLFWIHLAAGLVAGLVVLLMSATGVLLTFEKQLLAWSDRTGAAAPPAADAPRLPVEKLVAGVRAAEPSGAIAGVTISAVDGAPALVTIGQRTIAVNAYTGEVLGDASPQLRMFFRSVTAWHRWLGVEGQGVGREVARLFTGWGNFLFLVIILVGPILWIPRTWTRAQLRAVTLFKGGLRGKARDFNWHNVIGIWCVVPLILIVASALPMSFPWANAALYQMAGETPPEPGRGPQAPRDRVGSDTRRSSGRRGERPVDRADAASQTLDALWQRAEREAENWRSISLRLPNDANAPVTFTIDRGTGGQPQLRSTLTIDRSTGDVIRSETFETQTLGRRLRTFARFAHTGEFFGIVGQTIAGLASAGAVVLTWTGVALALRRFGAWRKRRRDRALVVAQTSAA